MLLRGRDLPKASYVDLSVRGQHGLVQKPAFDDIASAGAAVPVAVHRQFMVLGGERVLLHPPPAEGADHLVVVWILLFAAVLAL